MKTMKIFMSILFVLSTTLLFLNIVNLIIGYIYHKIKPEQRITVKLSNNVAFFLVIFIQIVWWLNYFNFITLF